MKISSLKYVVCAAIAGAILTTHAFAAEKKMPAPATMKKVEAALADFAKELSQMPLQPRTVHNELIAYLKKNPFVYGAAFAFAPAEQSGAPIKVSPYVYMHQGQFIVKELEKVGGNYTKAEWYTVPAESKKPYWSKPYFDKTGGKINMITYSIPVYYQDDAHTFMGVVTSDLPVE